MTTKHSPNTFKILGTQYFKSTKYKSPLPFLIKCCIVRCKNRSSDWSQFFVICQFDLWYRWLFVRSVCSFEFIKRVFRARVLLSKKCSQTIVRLRQKCKLTNLLRMCHSSVNKLFPSIHILILKCVTEKYFGHHHILLSPKKHYAMTCYTVW